ncbi:hypothetical protein [Shewanella fodinae]|uniref:Uncharacterized protein n=1 Tax=Shewanella fodinae TaxID=552357 RepID=A0A4R2F7B8_9GAMM|nr:hypothetical protein [Shewanella fodinae]TCN77730.1 hypothetical protein EDC91_14431 [Shewanella fodinae]
MKEKLLNTIIKLTNEKREIECQNGPFSIEELPNVYIRTFDVAKHINIDIQALFEPLEELELDGYINDLSKTSMSWGRSIGGDGKLSISSSDIELIKQ